MRSLIDASTSAYVTSGCTNTACVKGSVHDDVVLVNVLAESRTLDWSTDVPYYERCLVELLGHAVGKLKCDVNRHAVHAGVVCLVLCERRAVNSVPHECFFAFIQPTQLVNAFDQPTNSVRHDTNVNSRTRLTTRPPP